MTTGKIERRVIRAEQEGTGRLELRAPDADIAVIASPEVDLVEVTLGAEGDHALQAMRQAAVRVDGANLRVEVPETRGSTVASGPTTTATAQRLLVQVRIPAGSALHTRTRCGTVRVHGELATVVAASVSGAIVLDAVVDADMTTVSGQARVETAHTVSASTTTGDITVGTVGHRARLHSTSGRITVREARTETLTAHTLDGDIDVRPGPGIDTDDDRWDVFTLSGRIVTPAAQPVDEAEGDWD
uniref:DUF4097 family beta strand repeat-containing protein n=1 Tax=Actinokineospora sp. CA-119265 TaxID=3239890 RepID=UPI003F49A72A